MKVDMSLSTSAERDKRRKLLPLCPRCGEPASKAKEFIQVTLDIEIKGDSVGYYVTKGRQVLNTENLTYVCSGGHEWKIKG